MHPMGAERAQECVAITSHDLTSMIYQTQFEVASYDRWVLDHDMRSALAWHRRFLQVLQWKTPGKHWALKSPQHLWRIQHVHREYQVVDLYFQDFVKDQVGSVRRAYQHFGLDLSDDAANAMQAFLDHNPVDKHGKHLYSFEDIGMDEQRVCEMFHEYQSYFDIPVEAV
jgi:hypothetical protein